MYKTSYPCNHFENIPTLVSILFVQLELGMLKSMVWFIVYTPQSD